MSEPTPEARIAAVVEIVNKALHRYKQGELDDTFAETVKPLTTYEVGLGKPGVRNPELESIHERKVAHGIHMD